MSIESNNNIVTSNTGRKTPPVPAPSEDILASKEIESQADNNSPSINPTNRPGFAQSLAHSNDLSPAQAVAANAAWMSLGATPA